MRNFQHLVLVLFFLFMSNNLLSQYCGIDLNRLSGAIFLPKDVELHQGMTEDMEKNTDECKKCLQNAELTLNHKARLSDRIAGAYFYFTTDIDSVHKYLQKSYKFDSLWFKKSVARYTYLAEKGEPTIFQPYYFFNREIQEKHPSIFRFDKSKYYLQFDSIKNSNKIKGNIPDYINSISALKIKDQKYRKIENMDFQKKLDNENRTSLDSLFNIYGFPSIEKVGTNQSLTPWLVLQHSTDCEWNEKWLKRFLDAYQKEEIKAGLLKETFHRFYNKENGYCRDQDAESAQEFIDSLKTTYPLEYQETFGYKDY